MSKYSLIFLLGWSALSQAVPFRQRGGHYRPQPKFVEDGMFDSNVGDKFILGHDDEPDYNDDHTQDDYPSQFSPFQYNEPKSSQFVQDSQEQDPIISNDAFMKAFLANKFSKYEETVQQKGNQETDQAEEKEELKTEPKSEEISENVLEPNLREFTLLISKLLFHLSQM